MIDANTIDLLYAVAEDAGINTIQGMLISSATYNIENTSGEALHIVDTNALTILNLAKNHLCHTEHIRYAIRIIMDSMED